MFNKIFSFLVLFLFTVSASADYANFCQAENSEDFTVWKNAMVSRTSLAFSLYSRNHTANSQSLLNEYNGFLEELAGVDVNTYIEAAENIASGCYSGFPNSVASSFFSIYCSSIDRVFLDKALRMTLAAKLIIDGTTKDENTRAEEELKNSTFSVTFVQMIYEMFRLCDLNGSGGVPLPTPEPTPIDDPFSGNHFCSASPTAPLTDFLWKPISESDGRLVVLTNPASSVTVGSENLADRGASNGRCSTLRAGLSGCRYGSKVLVRLNTFNQFHLIEIPNGCNRYDCRGGLSNCGLKSYTERDLKKFRKQQKRIKKKLRNSSLTKNKKKKLRKKLRKIKPFVKIAKEEGVF